MLVSHLPCINLINWSSIWRIIVYLFLLIMSENLVRRKNRTHKVVFLSIRGRSNKHWWCIDFDERSNSKWKETFCTKKIREEKSHPTSNVSGQKITGNMKWRLDNEFEQFQIKIGKARYKFTHTLTHNHKYTRTHPNIWSRTFLMI